MDNKPKSATQQDRSHAVHRDNNVSSQIDNDKDKISNAVETVLKAGENENDKFVTEHATAKQESGHKISDIPNNMKQESPSTVTLESELVKKDSITAKQESTPEKQESTPEKHTSSLGKQESTPEKHTSFICKQESTFEKQESTPVKQESTSGKQTSSLEKQESTPGKQESTPGKQESTPEKQESTPGKQESTPEKQESTPGKQESTPEKQESTPGKQESTPEKQESTPGKQESTPEKQESTPVKQESTSGKQESTPVKQESTSGKQESTPGKQESTPEKQESTPGKQESTPEKQESTPGKQESTPEKQESTSGKQESTPGKQESTSGKQESTPEKQESTVKHDTTHVKQDPAAVKQEPTLNAIIINDHSDKKVTDKIYETPLLTNENTSGIIGLLVNGCQFDRLPSLPKKVVRIFVSSTFTDTKEERNALMQHVYPKLADYCREKHGLEFQIVDMRWGVPEQASDNHTTSELCIQEIRKCQEVSAGPNFVAIVGDKYGYRPIPNTIDTEVFKALQSTSNDVPEDWKVVEDWYRQDTNAIPPVYILQPISSIIENYQKTENLELRKAALDKWNLVNQVLTRTLRHTAKKAFDQGKISLTQKIIFFMSVTENEITSGVLQSTQKLNESCYAIIRKIPDINQYLTEKISSRFTDITETNHLDNEAQGLLQELRDVKLGSFLPESNLTKLDIEWSVSGAAVSIEQFKDIDVVKYAQKMMNDKDITAYKHKEYLDKICNDFFKKICKLVNQGSMRQTEMYDDLSTELLQHYHLAKMRCDMFEGREDLLNQAEDYLQNPESSNPLVIYGNSGCGKTSVMAKIMEFVSNNQWKSSGKHSYVVIARFLGTTTKTSNVHQLLVNICTQLAIIFQVNWEEPEQFSELVKSFYKLLENASENRPILLLLDSIDQLMVVYNAYKLDWLPDDFPPHVKVVASTIDEGYPILDSFKEKYMLVGLECIEVNPLGDKLGMNIISKWLQKDGRTMTSQQAQVIQEALLKCSLPLYARIAYDQIRKWKSYDTPSVEQLETTVKGAINKLFQYMENKFGQVVVKHCLSYLTTSRYGLSEAELEHILSLDDILLNKVFHLWKPPVRRIPPLIWTRIRSEIHSYIVERSADDVLVLYWYHRQFIQTTRSRYLQDDQFTKHITDHLIEYFSGEWSSGKDKPFQYTQHQVKRFQLDSPNSSADRKVPAQPYWTENISLGEAKIRYNKRRLSELTFHLLRNKSYAKLKELAFFSYEWLYAKVKSTSPQQMLEEINIFMQASKFLMKDTETRLLYVNLQLIRPYIIAYPDSLSYELTGRLAKYMGQYPMITKLIKECDSFGKEHCPLIPLSTSCETANIGFTQNIIFRKIKPWHQGGSFTSSNDFKMLYVIDYDEEGLPIILTYDIGTGEKVNQVHIHKANTESKKLVTDLYFKMYVVNNGKWLVACYKERMDATYKKEVKQGEGLIDVIDIATGNVKATYDTFTYRDEFIDPVVYLTDCSICYTLGWKVPIVNFVTDNKQSYNRPTVLSHSEKLLILCSKDSIVLRELESKGTIGIFDMKEAVMAVTATKDFRTIAMIGRETNQIKVYDMRNKILEAKESYQMIKSKHIFKLNDETASEVAKSNNNRIIMKFSHNGEHLMVVFIGLKWMACLWTIWSPGKNMSRFVGAITPYRMPCTYKIPIFNFDGSALIYAQKRKVLVVSTSNVQVMNEYEMKEDIKDICVSEVSNKLAVMLQKRIVLLDVLKSEQDQAKGKGKVTEALTEVLLHREIVKGVPMKEVVCKVWDNNMEIDQVDDLVVGVDTDRLVSARSRANKAISEHITPNGERVIHFHRKLQVIDTRNNAIKHTPRSGEHILRTVVGNEGEVTNKTLEIQGLDSSMDVLSNSLVLKQGDRIVNENNKVKFRVNKEPVGQFQVMTVPSIITVYTTEELKLRKLQRITVYQESILDISNSFIITTKSNSKGHFVNIYNQTEGKLLATHEMCTKCECAKFSFDEIQLFVVDRSLTVQIYQSPTFTSLEAKISLMEGQISSAFVVKDIIHFPKNRECLLVRYGPEGPDVFVRSRYLYFNIITHEKSCEMQVTPAFADISSDGKFAIDNDLKVYDLSVGKVFTKVVYNRNLADDERERQVQVVVNRRMQYTELSQSLLMSIGITDDGYIIYANRQDNTIHLAKLMGNKIKHLVSCFTHINDMKAQGLSIRHHQRVITLTSGSTIIVLAINCNRTTNFKYLGELSRATSIVNSFDHQKSANPNIKQPDQTKPSIFMKKKALLHQIATETGVADRQKDKERILIVKDAHKPNVLVVGEAILCSNIFNSDSFSPYLATEKMSVQNAVDAYTKLKENHLEYKVIILQLITDDVTIFEASICIKKIELVVELAREKADIVILSLAPLRSDTKEFSDRVKEVNEKLSLIYASSCGNGKHLHICKNSNMKDSSENPVSKYFKDSVHLSPSGLKRICRNFKDVLAPLLGNHYI